MAKQDDWITTKEATELTGYNSVYLRELLRSQKINGKKWGRDWQVSRQNLLAYMEAASKSTDKRKGAKKED